MRISDYVSGFGDDPSRVAYPFGFGRGISPRTLVFLQNIALHRPRSTRRRFPLATDEGANAGHGSPWDLREVCSHGFLPRAHGKNDWRSFARPMVSRGDGNAVYP
jgi:hypothetical protein